MHLEVTRRRRAGAPRPIPRSARSAQGGGVGPICGAAPVSPAVAGSASRARHASAGLVAACVQQGRLAASVAPGDPAGRGRARGSRRQRRPRRCSAAWSPSPGAGAVRDPDAARARGRRLDPRSARRRRRRARRLLPDQVSFEDAAFNVGRTALLVAALAAGDVGALAHRDRGPPAPGPAPGPRPRHPPRDRSRRSRLVRSRRGCRVRARPRPRWSSRRAPTRSRPRSRRRPHARPGDRRCRGHRHDEGTE